MTTTYSPNPHLYEESDFVWRVTNEVHTAEIEKARKHLAKAIEAKGEDYVYQEHKPGGAANAAGNECLYLEYEHIDCDEEEGTYNFVGPKGPSCIVGHVLVYAEVPYPKITPHEGENAGEAAKEAFTSPIAIEALNRAQAKQDHANGYTWGEAVEEFEAFVYEHTIRTEQADG